LVKTNDLFAVVAAWMVLSGQPKLPHGILHAQASTCDVTMPNDVGILGNTERGSYGNGRLSV
jgi:hypothetical protein